MQDTLAARLSGLTDKLGLKAEDCDTLGKAIKYEAQRVEERQSKKIDKLEEQMNAMRVTIVETDGRVDNLKTSIEGEIKLLYKMLSHVSEKIERIESNTSNQQKSRRTWLIALVAAIPGFISVLIEVLRMTGGN